MCAVFGDGERKINYLNDRAQAVAYGISLLLLAVAILSPSFAEKVASDGMTV